MKNNILKSTILIFVLLIQIFFNEYFVILGIKPDLILITLLIMALYAQPIFLLLMAFILGLMQDWFMLTPLIGLSPLLKTIFAYIIIKFTQNFRLYPNIFLFTINILLILLYFILYNWISLSTSRLSFTEILIQNSLPEFLYTGVLFIIFNFLILYYNKNRE
ncbi:MAG: rod shape-determining protein MreD [Candidatus Marinimicrobia bacterium]|nr:rod shape-determining protein MreD [Candidatus Neomarinimicrobiota bacterium]